MTAWRKPSRRALRLRAAPVLACAALLVAASCSDDVLDIDPVDLTSGTDTGGTSGTTLPGTTTTEPTTTTDPTTTTATTTATSTSDATTGSTGDGTTGSTGDGTGTTGIIPVDEPQSVTQMVNAGQQASSTNYTMVFTLGQPSPAQSTHVSTNYQLQGGLVGANGSPP